MKPKVLCLLQFNDFSSVAEAKFEANRIRKDYEAQGYKEVSAWIHTAKQTISIETCSTKSA